MSGQQKRVSTIFISIHDPDHFSLFRKHLTLIIGRQMGIILLQQCGERAPTASADNKFSMRQLFLVTNFYIRPNLVLLV